MNEQITVNLNNFTKEEREQFKKLLNKGSGEPSKESRVWKPEDREKYYYIDGYSCVIDDTCEGLQVDVDRFDIGNVFKTKEEAKIALERAQVKTELERYALEHNDPEKEAWDGNNSHFSIVHEALSEESIRVSRTLGAGRDESVTYFTSKDIAEGAIKSVGKDRILKYLFGVDCEEETDD